MRRFARVLVFGVLAASVGWVLGDSHGWEGHAKAAKDYYSKKR